MQFTLLFIRQDVSFSEFNFESILESLSFRRDMNAHAIIACYGAFVSKELLFVR